MRRDSHTNVRSDKCVYVSIFVLSKVTDPLQSNIIILFGCHWFCCNVFAVTSCFVDDYLFNLSNTCHFDDSDVSVFEKKK